MSDSVVPEAVANTVTVAQPAASGGERARTMRPGGGGRGLIMPPFEAGEHARAMAARRWALARRRAAEQVARRVGAVASKEDQAVLDAAPKEKRWAAAYGVLAGVQAERAYMDADPQSFRAVRVAIGADVGAPERAAPGGGGLSSALDADLRELLAAWRAAKADNPELAARARAAARGDDGGDG